MDIRLYPVKRLPYHFVLFYNLEGAQLTLIKLTSGGNVEDNAVLTYCYLDTQCGLSYKVICCAHIDESGKIALSTSNKRSAGFTLREGGLTGDAEIYDEGGDLEQFQDEVDQIKKCYGYYPEKVAIDEEDPYSRFRHPLYPDDIFVCFIDKNHTRENMWVTQIDKDEDGWITGKLINEPYNKAMGVHEGDMVQIYPLNMGNGTYIAGAILPWMKELKYDVILRSLKDLDAEQLVKILERHL